MFPCRNGFDYSNLSSSICVAPCKRMKGMFLLQNWLCIVCQDHSAFFLCTPPLSVFVEMKRGPTDLKTHSAHYVAEV